MGDRFKIEGLTKLRRHLRHFLVGATFALHKRIVFQNERESKRPPGRGIKMRSIFRGAVSKSHVTSLSGPLNVNRSEYVVQHFRDLSERGIERVVVSLEDVPFIDSQGLAALIAGYKIFGSDPRYFRLTGIQDQPKLVFELTGFDHVFQTGVHSADARTDVIAVNLPAYVLSQIAVPDMAA
jgi:anti-anti-sigma factor